MSSSQSRRDSKHSSKHKSKARKSSSRRHADGEEEDGGDAAALEHRQSWTQSAEALFDYVNDSATKLARVVAAQRDRLVGGPGEDADAAAAARANGWRPEDMPPRKLSVHASIKDRKSGQRVRFVSEVDVYRLPQREGSDAWRSRRGPWGPAPPSDEVWDGEAKTMRPQELSAEQLAALAMSQRESNMRSFWDSIKPLFGARRPAHAPSRPRLGTDDSDSDSSSDDGEDSLDLVVEIELVDEEEAAREQALSDAQQQQQQQRARGGKRDSVERAKATPAAAGTGKRDSVERHAGGHSKRDSVERTASNSKRNSVERGVARESIERERRNSVERARADSIEKRSSVDRATFGTDVARVYGASAGERRKFTFAAPTERTEALRKSKTTLVRQNQPAAKLSGSQASAAASAGRVLLMRASSGKAFGAAVKRKVQLRAQREASLTRPKSAEEYYQGDLSKRRSTRRGKRQTPLLPLGKRPSLRTPGTGLSLRPRYIVIYLLIPLFLIGIDDAMPVFEHIWNVALDPSKAYRYQPSKEVTIPWWMRIVSPDITPESKRLKDTYKFGAYVVEFGGLLVLLQIVQQLVVLFRAGRTIMRVHVEDWDSDEDEFDSDETSSADLDAAAKNYGFLFKWQAPQK